ncbi:protein TASOR 2 isoform X3 [Delphinus delphis]|uniref:protein TASOR 2 isoform X3 n=1 Tax=Delphinus delphis TaxID=9728 RepID=UPI0028C43EAB|nr:protein TASOR 2 isoform X3 [Delphinus delphis]
MGRKLNADLRSAGAAAAHRTVFETVSLSSDSLFQRAVSILHTSYLDSASEHGFQYSQVTLVKNDIFLNEYKTFYQEKKASNYTHEELQETYGFLLFETENQAKLVCQRGLCVGSSAITTLGDPGKGVYISKYSDYLHARPWYHGKSGYVVIFNLIKGRVKFVSENYTTNYTSPSSGYDCHVAVNTNKVSHKTSHFRTFELNQYYLYELSGSTVIERPRQICPYVIVAFQYREPKKMAAPAHNHKSILELKEDVLIYPWKGKLIIQGCLMCDITLWSSYGTLVPKQLPHELDFKYVMKVSSLKNRLPEAAFRKQNYVEHKVCCQDMCFNMYEVELSNKQGEKVDKLTEYIKREQLAIIKCLEDREFFILLTSSAFMSETSFGEEQMGLHGLHLFHSSPSAGLKDLKVEDDISLKVVPILPALNCALLEAKKSFSEKGICLNTLVKHNLQELYKVDKSPSLTAASQDGIKETAFFGKVSSGFDVTPSAEKCPLQSLTQLRSYFSNPNGYILEVSTALDLLAECPQSPCISDGICDAGFSLVMTPDAEFHDSEAEVREETETQKNSEEMFKARQGALVPLSPASNLRVQPKRKAGTLPVVQSKRVKLCRPFPRRTPAGANKRPDSPTTLKFPQKRENVMTPDPEFHDSAAEVRKETETQKNSEEMFKARQGALVPLSPASNLRVQPKRKAGTLPVVRSKRVKLCRPFPRRTPAGANKRPDSPTTLKFPRKRENGAEVLTAQFVQTTKLDWKNQEAPISEDVPVSTNAKRARKQETSPVKTVPRAEPPVKKSPQKQRENIVKGNQNPRIRKQPQPAKGETSSQLQSEISDGQEVISISTAQPENITVAPEDPPENSIVNCDSQALNMLADLALSAATSTTPSSEPRNLPCSSELPQNDVLLSKEHSLRGTSDHEYHRGVKSQKGGPLSKPSDKSNLTSDPTVSQEEESLVAGIQAPAEAQLALPEETLGSSDASQSSFVAVEHSYALLLAEHSKKHLQQRGAPGPAFAKNGTKGPEAGTPVGKVMPFRHQQVTSPLQQLSEAPALRRRSRVLPSSLQDFCRSRTVFSCDSSFKVTFIWEADYVFSLDSKYTNNPLEKTVIRALHGPWNTDLPDNMEEVRLLLHMWVALFYSNQNKGIQSSRKVVEHSNPAKYVCINSTLESFEFSEIEESSGVERCSVDPLLETNEAPRGPTAKVSFPDTDPLLPFMKPPPVRGLELWVQNEQKEMFATAGHPETPESQNFIYSCNNEIIGGKVEQESSDKLETSNLVLSSIGSTQTNGSSIPAEDKTFEPLDGTQVTSYNDTVTQSTFARTYDGISNPSMIFQKSVYSTLESKVDVFHAKMQTKTGALQGLIQHSNSINKECQSSLEGEDDTEYVVINLEPVTFTFEKNAYAPIQTEVVNRADKPTTFNVELIKQVSPATSLRHPVSTFEKAQTQGLRDVPSLAVSGQQGAKYLCASSVSREILAKEMCSLQKGQAVVGSPSPSDNSLVTEALSLVKSSSYLLPREEMKLSQECFLSAQSLFSISSEETVESSQLEEVVSSSASDPLEEKDSLDCIPSMRNASDGSSELKNDKSGLNSENMSFETFNSAFTKQTSLSVTREEVSLELSEEDSDLDLTLTISPPTSPWEEASAGEMEQQQEATLPCLELQETVEEIIEPEEVPDVNSADHTSMKPRESERKGDNLQTVAFILSKETCALEVAEEVHAGSDFSFSSLIEEVSPASSPDCQVPGEEAQPAWAVSPSSFKLCDAHCKKTDRSSQVETVDLAITEKENSFVGPTHPVGQDNLTQIQQMQLSAEMPLILKNHPGRKDRFLTLPGEVTEEIVPSECGEGYSFSEKVPHHDAELNQPASAATCRDSLENLVTSRNPLQPMSVENRNPHLSHLVDTSEPPFSPQKILENKSFADTFVSTTTPSGVNVSLKQQTSSKSLKENDSSSDVKTNELCYILVKSLCLDPVAGAEAVQARGYLELPKPTLFSGGATLTHRAGPSDAEMEFETQEMIVRMASLLKNNETGAELCETAIDLGGVGSQLHTTSSEDRHKPAHMLQDESPCSARALLNGGLFPVCLHADSYQNTAATGETIDTEPSSFVPKSCAPLVCGVFEEQVEDKSADEGLRAEWGSVTRGGGLDVSGNSDIHYEPLSGDSDQDSFGECGNPRLDTEESCTLRYSHTEKKQRTSKDGFDSFLNLNNSDNDDWGYSSQVPGLETGISPRSWPMGLKKEDKCVPSYVQIRDLRGIPRTYANFTVTKDLRDTTRTLHSLCRHPGITAKGGLLSSWTDTWQVADDLTQNTLDLEYLRFAHKLKQIVKTGVAPCSAPSTAVFPKEPPLQGAMGAFPATKVPEAPGLPPSSRSRSPLMVTVVHSDPRHQGQQARRQTPSCVGRSSSSWKERCGHDRNHLPNSERNSTVSYHLNKLKYNSTLKESRNDISLILSEYAEFNKVMNSHPVIFQEKEPHAASGEAKPRELCPSIPRSASYDDMVADLCTSLHVKLERVVKEACTRTFLFHLVETEDKSFFVRTKHILRKGGYTEIEPQHFCQAFYREKDMLIVIIRNEDISSHLHQIPSLLKLKHLPSVIFAGIDSPEDVLSYTYQELFQTGGFVVSDDRILETLTLVQLKEIIRILEKLNENGRWKWLLHYRETKKLKEDVRVDSIAYKKNLILKSYQSANIFELLHYHQCDSRLSTKAEHLKCLLNLQIQRVHARFAVFLTEKPVVSRDVFENSGILVTDVNDFIENIQKVAAPFRSSYW